MKFIAFNILIVTCAISLFSCKQESNITAKEEYEKYSLFADHISEFSALMTVTSSDITDKMEIDFSSRALTIKNIVSKKSVIVSASVSNGKITIEFKSGKKQTFDDTVENRLAFRLPADLGINPYYILQSSIKPKIQTEPDGSVSAGFLYDGNSIVQNVHIEKSVPVKAENKINGELIQLFEYSDFVSDKNYSFPSKYIETDYTKNPDGKKIKSTRIVTYSIKKFITK